jgi:hypothetical protein
MLIGSTERRCVVKVIVVLLLSFAALSTYAQTYNGPQDPAIYREPNNVLCSGIPNFPTGANLDFPRKSSIGNLQDGLTLSIPNGVDGAFIFMGLTLTGKDRLEGEFLLIDDLTSLPPANSKGSKITLSAYHGRTSCIVRTWYKPLGTAGH